MQFLCPLRFRISKQLKKNLNQTVTKLKNSNCDKNKKKLNCDKTKKNLIVTKLNNSNCGGSNSDSSYSDIF